VKRASGLQRRRPRRRSSGRRASIDGLQESKRRSAGFEECRQGRRHGRPVARLAAAAAATQSPFGAMRGEFELPEGWDRPFTAHEADAFWAGK